jgi:hypothetical protein
MQSLFSRINYGLLPSNALFTLMCHYKPAINNLSNFTNPTSAPLKKPCGISPRRGLATEFTEPPLIKHDMTIVRWTEAILCQPKATRSPHGALKTRRHTIA